MADKFKTAIDDDKDWVKLKYGDSPNQTNAKVLIRAVFGIDRSAIDGIVSTLHSTTSRTDPKADFETYSGTWRVSRIDVEKNESGSLFGSDTLIETLLIGFFTYCSADNEYVQRIHTNLLEQAEYPWMIYERYVRDDTRKWVGLSYATASAIMPYMDNIFEYNTVTSWSGGAYNNNRIFHVTTAFTPGSPLLNGFSVGPWTPGYYITTYGNPISSSAAISNSRIQECWIELEQDGSYTLFRTIRQYSEPAIMRIRPLQYAGCIRIVGYPILDDEVITLDGFEYATERIYEHARLRIGGEIYRVTADTDAIAGVASGIPITPPISQVAEDAIAEAPANEYQIFFEAI